jgi:hypothetical protein
MGDERDSFASAIVRPCPRQKTARPFVHLVESLISRTKGERGVVMTKAKVSGLLGVAVLVLSANGCGDVGDPTESKSGALINQWTQWFSEEQGVIMACNPWSDNAAVMGIKCSNSYCDNMSLFCNSFPAGFTPRGTGGSLGNGWNWGNPQFISEESPNNVSYCPANSIVIGMYTTGSFSDNIAIQCRDVNFPPQGVTCRWTNWESEEQAPQYFDADFNRPGGAVATAVMCSGSYCDNVSFLACEPRCTSDADCGVYSCGPNHWCVVG